MKYILSWIGLLFAAAVTHPTLHLPLSATETDLLSAASPADVGKLIYALTLTQVKDAFFRQGLEQYSESQFLAAGLDSNDYADLRRVSEEERGKVQLFQTALAQAEARAPRECTYNFRHDNPSSLVAMRSLIEGIGLSTHIISATYLASYRLLPGNSRTRSPENHNSPGQQPLLGTSQTIPEFEYTRSLAWPFFVSCPPGNPKQPIVAFPRLKVNTKGPVRADAEVTLVLEGTILTDRRASDGQVYGAFLTSQGPLYVEAYTVAEGFTLKVPADLHTDTFLVLTVGRGPVSDDTTIAGPVILHVGQ